MKLYKLIRLKILQYLCSHIYLRREGWAETPKCSDKSKRYIPIIEHYCVKCKHIYYTVRKPEEVTK